MIQKYKPTDIDAIIDCLTELMSAENRIESIRVKGKKAAKAYFKEVEQKIKHHAGQIFVAKKGKIITGVLIVSIEQNEIIEKSGKHLLILDIAVKSQYRKTGIGKELMKKAESFALENGLDEIRLYTLINNYEGLKLFYRNGFDEFGLSLTKRIRKKK